MNYLPHIDGLRAIAVTAVLIFHYYPKVLPGGFVGVDVFFVISGFLITGILYKDITLDRLSFRRFYVNRVCRIFPALILLLTFALLAGWFSLYGPEFKILGKHVLNSVFFFQNFNLLKESGYFDTSSDLKPLLHLWSIARINSPAIKLDLPDSHSIKIICSLLTILLTLVTYYLVEISLRKVKIKYEMTLTWSLVGLLAVCGFSGYFIWIKEGFADRFQNISFEKYQAPKSYDCLDQVKLKGVE